MSSVNTISGSIKWSGLATGTDFASIVQELMKIEKRVITRQQTWQSEWQVKLEKINSLDVRLGSLKMNAQDYDTREELLARAAASSKPEVATITNTSTAATGIYDLEVGKDIQEKVASKTYSNAKAIGWALDASGNVKGATDAGDDNVLKAVALALGGGLDWHDLGYDPTTHEYTDGTGTVRAKLDPGTGAITKYDSIVDLSAIDIDAIDALYKDAVKSAVASALNKGEDVVESGGFFYDRLAFSAAGTAAPPLAALTGTAIDNSNPVASLSTSAKVTIPTDAAVMDEVAVALGLKDHNDLVYTSSGASGYYSAKNDPFKIRLAEYDGTTSAITTRSQIMDFNNPADPVMKKGMAKFLGVAGVEYVPSGAGGYYYDAADKSKTPLVQFDGTTLFAGGKLIARQNAATKVITNAAGAVIPADTPASKDPLTIEMGGKKLTLTYSDDDALLAVDANGKLTSYTPGTYHPGMTMDQLAQAINATVADGKAKDKANVPPTENTPDISAKVVFDKTRGSDIQSRLVITGGVGGSANHITVSDPTNLGMDENSIDAPVTETWKNNIKPEVSGTYTGHTNKTITVVATAATGGAVLGTDDITFSWADTEGKSGTFVVKASDWDTTNNRLKEDIELVQGVKINFQGPAGHPDQNYMNKNDAFTIDCQTPVIQKAADVGLAQTDKWVHVGVASLTDPIATGGEHFVFSYGGKECDITLTGGSVSLSSLVEQINRSSKNPGVIASILNDGMGTATSYKLVLTGRQAGLENSIVIDTTKTKLHYGTTNTRTDSGAWEHAREASNSMCRVDDYPKDGAWIQRSSNEIGDVIDGVVVTLQGAGTTQITVQNNVTEMVNRIKQLVQSVNYCKQYIKDETKWGGGKLVSKVLADGSFSRETEGGGGTVPGIDGEVKASGAMIGNYGFQISQSNIDRLVTSVIFTREEFIRAMDNNYDGTHPGDFSKLPVTVEDEDPDNPTSQTGLYNKYLKDNGLEYTRLSDIGIASDPSNQGLYIVENSKLTEVLTKNPEAVIKLFTFVPPDEPPFQDNTKLDSKLRGRVPAPYKPFDDENERPFIRGFAQGMAYAMSDLTRTGDVIDPKTGAVIKPAKGIMRVLSENYSNIISGIDEKIARETKRISMVEARLTEKFSRLETLLSQLQNQQTKNAAALAQLDNKSSSS